MNEKTIRLYNAITDIDDELIEEANQPPKKKRTPILKTLLIAAAIIVLLVSGLSVYASANNTDIPSLLMKIIGQGVEFEGFLEKLENTEANGYALTDTAFAKEMEKKGIKPVTAPAFFGDNALILTEGASSGDDVSSYVKDAFMEFQSGEYSGLLEIEQYTNPPEENSVQTLGYQNIKNGKIVNANGMDVIVLEADGVCHLYYRDRNTLYYIDIENVDYEIAIRIAESIE